MYFSTHWPHFGWWNWYHIKKKRVSGMFYVTPFQHWWKGSHKFLFIPPNLTQMIPNKKIKKCYNQFKNFLTLSNTVVTTYTSHFNIKHNAFCQLSVTFLWEAVDLNNKLRNTLNGDDLTLSLPSWGHWDWTLNKEKTLNRGTLNQSCTAFMGFISFSKQTLTGFLHSINQMDIVNSHEVCFLWGMR
jgi:hypothetical protein